MQIKNYSESAAMNLTPDRQGYLGDLMQKTVPQLEELLERQRKILAKRQFIENLPDKGEKTKIFANFIEKLIEEKKVYIQKTTSQVCIVSQPQSEKVTKSSTTAEIDKGKINETNASLQSTTDYDLVSELQLMSIDSTNSTKKGLLQNLNSFESVIKRSEETLSNSKTKFLPNRTLKGNHIPPPPQGYTLKPKQLHKEEESAAHPPHYKFNETKIIPIEESIKLLQEQRAKTEVLNAEWAAKRLADQLVPKMVTYRPSSNVDLQYRETKNKDIDSDDDDDDETQDED